MWIRGEPPTGTERDLISHCGAFFGLGLGSLFAHLGRRGASIGFRGRAGAQSTGDSSPSLVGCAIEQSLPASTTLPPGSVAGARAQSAVGENGPLPGGIAVGQNNVCLNPPCPSSAVRSAAQTTAGKGGLPEAQQHKQSQEDIWSSTERHCPSARAHGMGL